MSGAMVSAKTSRQQHQRPQCSHRKLEMRSRRNGLDTVHGPVYYKYTYYWYAILKAGGAQQRKKFSGSDAAGEQRMPVLHNWEGPIGLLEAYETSTGHSCWLLHWVVFGSFQDWT